MSARLFFGEGGEFETHVNPLVVSHSTLIGSVTDFVSRGREGVALSDT